MFLPWKRPGRSSYASAPAVVCQTPEREGGLPCAPPQPFPLLCPFFAFFSHLFSLESLPFISLLTLPPALLFGPALVPARLLFSPGLLDGARRVEAGSDILEESQPSAHDQS